MIEVIQSIAAIGGFGFLNFKIISKLSDVDFGSESDRKYFIYFLSSFHYLVYLVINYFINNMVWSIILSILLILLVTFILPISIDKYYLIINWIRKKRNMENVAKTKMFDIYATDFSKINCYIFTLNGEVLISSGYTGSTSGINDDLSLIVYPYIKNNDSEKYNIKTQETLFDYFEKYEIEANVYINFEKSVKIIYF